MEENLFNQIMHGKIISRLFSGGLANIFGQIVTVIIQLISIPLLLAYWGVNLYGEWLLLSAIPVYLSMSDLGFGSVAANQMTMLMAKGDKKSALEVSYLLRFKSNHSLLLFFFKSFKNFKVFADSMIFILRD